jgi:uncharacterized Ntn-hydrolase superfamily protein
MTKYLITLLFILFISFEAFATWSIIIIDPKTKEIGIAAASCTYNCYGIGRVIPGMGAIIVQAMSNNDAREKGIEMIIAEASPEQIVQALRDTIFEPERQQYAVITVKYIDQGKIYTGTSTKPFNGGFIDYGVSVQGNALTNEAELQAVMDAIQKGKKDLLHITDILMTALEAGSNAGGDKLCGEQKSTSAFIIVAKPNDKKPYLDLSIFGQAQGKENAVDLLRAKFDKWKKKHKSGT